MRLNLAMQKGFRQLGGFIPSLDALEDRQLLSAFGEPSFHDVPFSMPRDDVAIAIGPFAPNRFPGAFQDHHQGLPDFPPYPLIDQSSVDSHSRGDAVPFAVVDRAAPFERDGPRPEHGQWAANPGISPTQVSPSIQVFDSSVNGGGAVGVSPARQVQGVRTAADTFGSPAAVVSRSDFPLIVASVNGPSSAFAGSGSPEGTNQANLPSLAVPPSVLQAVKPGPTSPSVMLLLDHPEEGLAEPVTRSLPIKASAVRTVEGDESPTLMKAENSDEIPPPKGADLITELVPFPLESIKDSLSWLLDPFETSEGPGSDTTRVFRFLIPIAIALGSFEIARRWRRDRSHLRTVRSWQTRCSALHGFF